jgi:hypothetical protein
MKNIFIGCFFVCLGIIILLFITVKILDTIESPSANDKIKLNELIRKYGNTYSFEFLGSSYLAARGRNNIIDKKEACTIYKTYILESNKIRFTYIILFNFYDKDDHFLFQIYSYQYDSGCSYQDKEEFQ